MVDGPWDFRDFFYKQAYISRLERPKWLHTRILDVRQAFGEWYAKKYLGKYNKGPQVRPSHLTSRQHLIVRSAMEHSLSIRLTNYRSNSSYWG